jgi:hypothetical protein
MEARCGTPWAPTIGCDDVSTQEVRIQWRRPEGRFVADQRSGRLRRWRGQGSELCGRCAMLFIICICTKGGLLYKTDAEGALDAVEAVYNTLGVYLVVEVQCSIPNQPPLCDALGGRARQGLVEGTRSSRSRNVRH